MEAWIRTGSADPDGPQQRPAQGGIPPGGPARQSAAYGYAVAAVDAPGCGDRPRSAADEQARADLRRAMQAGEPVDEIFESFNAPLVEKPVPEWRTTLDALLSLPEIGGPVGYSGWAAVGIRLAVVEPRIADAQPPRSRRYRPVGGTRPVRAARLVWRWEQGCVPRGMDGYGLGLGQDGRGWTT